MKHYLFVVSLLFLVVAECAIIRQPYSTLRCKSFWDKNREKDYNENTPVTRTCRMTNVCYNFAQSKWLFFRNPSAMIGEPKRNEKGYVDISNAKDEIILQTLANIGTYDSTATFKLDKIINAGGEDRRFSDSPVDLYWIDGDTVLFSAPSEMYWHWLFDDMFGLWWLLTEHGIIPESVSNDNVWNYDSIKNTTILLHDRISSHKKMMEYYFTNRTSPIKTLQDFSSSNEVCFQSLLVGPARHHVGGPGTFQVSGKDILNYRDFLLSRATLLRRGLPTDIQITIIARNTSRKILNLDEVVEGLKQRYPKYKIEVANMESMSYKEQLRTIQKTTILIAVHGSGMSNIAFLPKDSAVIEIFPYGFTRPTFQHLAQKIGISYRRWDNHHKENAVFHPEVLDRYSLSKEDKERILKANQFTVDLPWAGNMYWIDQDTIIIEEELALEINGALQSPLNKSILRKKKEEL